VTPGEGATSRLDGLGLNGGSRRSSDASSSVSLGPLLRDNWGVRELVRITDVDAKTLDVDVAVTPEQDGSETDLGGKIEDTIGDGLGVGGDHISALGNTPDDGVDEGDRNSPDGKDVVQAEDIGTKGTGIGTAFVKNGVGDKEERDNSEGEEACGS